jgi:hypothetical protein
MQGKITDRGWFAIKRGSMFKVQNCIKNLNETYCGDWCPAFGEPESHPETSREYGYSTLKLCFDTLKLERFVDERE